MYVHFGQDYYGKVDVVPDLCYVATRFFHVNLIPLIPLESSIVLIGTGKGSKPKTVKIALNFKSVLFAWLRMLLTIGLIGMTAVAAIETEQFVWRGPVRVDAADLAKAWGVAVAMGISLLFTYRFNRAGYGRARRIGEALGMEPGEIDKWLTPRERAAPEAMAPEAEGWERYK
jgi:hypothetical protein